MATELVQTAFEKMIAGQNEQAYGFFRELIGEEDSVTIDGIVTVQSLGQGLHKGEVLLLNLNSGGSYDICKSGLGVPGVDLRSWATGLIGSDGRTPAKLIADVVRQQIEDSKKALAS